MSKRRLAALGGVAVVAATALAVFLFYRGRTHPESAGGRSGAALAAGLGAAIEGAAEIAAPHRCARLTAATEPPVSAPIRARVEARGMSIEERTLHLSRPSSRRGRLVIGVVADARGGEGEAVAAQSARMRRQLEASGVHVLFSLGGMGRTQAEIAAALGPLAAGAPWPVIALPGDREPLAAHRSAIAELNTREDTLILDGSKVRLVVADSAIVGTLPGAAQASRLVAGADGCQYTAEDADALARTLLGYDKTRVWATHTPPRQAGADATDLALGGVHIGELGLAAAIAESKASLVLHGLVDEAAVRQRPGTRRLPTAQPLHLASGALDLVPVEAPGHGAVTGAAIVVSIGARELRWHPILFEAKRPRFPVR